VPLLSQFSAPGNLTELGDPLAWSQHVASEIAKFAADLTHFFDPLDAEGSPRHHPVPWPAFPGELRQPGASDEARWQAAEDRDNQDEYCEWAVQRSGDEIVSVTFTTETPDYFEHILDTNPDQFVALYQDLVGRRPDPKELRLPDGRFDAANAFNRSDDGTIAHLSETSNTLGAAVRLAAQATVLRVRDGKPVTEKKALVRCGDLGGQLRNSDPQIAEAVNGLVAARSAVSLANPPGLYLDEFLSAGLQTPDGADAGEFWQPVTRGDSSHVMRAVFAVPPERDYPVSDIVSGGQPIRFGAQLADRVRVRLTAISLTSDAEPSVQPCVDEAG